MKSRLILGVIIAFAIGVLALFLSAPSKAEGRCPDGYYSVGGGGAGREGCAAMGGGADDAGRVRPQWETRWGAAAVTNGAFGYSNNWPTEHQAINEALSRCSRDAGGATCTLAQSYHDQCIALAWGQKGSNTISAPNIGQAEQLAVENCSKRTTSCKIYYSGCSYPGRVR